MKKFKHILATTDLSPASLSAVKYAAHLAESDGARLTILHVADTTTLAYAAIDPPIDLGDLHRKIESGARTMLEDWSKRHCKGNTGVKVLVKSGVTHQVICETAAAVGASLIVIATHGRSGLGHVLLGSIAERVLRHAPCPVLTVRPPAPDKKKKKGK